jgi:hypothetical protein
MSYTQGTMVRLRADFRDTETGEPTDALAVILTVENPAGVMTQYTLADGDVKNDPDVVGGFYFDLDTSLLPGTWSYQFESTGNEATVGRKQLTVTPRLTPPIVVP